MAGKPLRAATAKAAPRKVSFAVVAGERPLWVPGSAAPEWLDGRHVVCTMPHFIIHSDHILTHVSFVMPAAFPVTTASIPLACVSNAAIALYVAYIL